MTRLVNDMRVQIIDALAKHTFSKEAAALAKIRSTLALDIYADVFGQGVITFDGLRDGWLPERSNFDVRYGGTYRKFHLNGESTTTNVHYVEPHLKETFRRLPYVVYKLACIVTYDARHKLAIRCEKDEQETKSLSERIHKARQAASATIAQFHTVEKLVEHWPEIAPFTKGFVAAPVKPLVVQTEHLNEMFKLP